MLEIFYRKPIDPDNPQSNDDSLNERVNQQMSGVETVYSAMYMSTPVQVGMHREAVSGLRVKRTINVLNGSADVLLCRDPFFDDGCALGQTTVTVSFNDNSNAAYGGKYEGYFCVTEKPLTRAEETLPGLVRKMQGITEHLEAVYAKQ